MWTLEAPEQQGEGGQEPSGNKAVGARRGDGLVVHGAQAGLPLLVGERVPWLQYAQEGRGEPRGQFDRSGKVAKSNIAPKSHLVGAREAVLGRFEF